MVSPEKIRQGWLKLLFSTEAADRPATEAALRDLYAALGLAPPLYFLWYDSPFDPAWAVALLQAPHESPWRQIMQQAERRPAERATIERIREQLRHRLAEANWAGVLKAMGAPLDEAVSNAAGDPLSQRIFNTRLELYPTRQALWKACSFTDDDDLQRAERHMVGIPSGVLGTQESARPVGLLICASARSLYPFSIMASDEAQLAGRKPPPLLDAYWRIARAAGMWWPFEHAVILTERPAEIHRNQRGLLHRSPLPAVVFRDGNGAFAWNGVPLPEKRIAPAPTKALSRLAIRPAVPGSDFLHRYMAGEHQQVWLDLIALGPRVRRKPYAADAVAVAHETMRRVEANVRTLVNRLLLMDYRFKTMSMYLDEMDVRTAGVLKLATKAGVTGVIHERLKAQLQLRDKRRLADYEIRAHTPPRPDTPRQLRKLRSAVGAAPLSLCAFYEVVGAVDLVGFHRTLSPKPGSTQGYVCPDPLVVFPLEEALRECESGESGAIILSPDDLHKADYSGGAPYEIAVPDECADGLVLNERHKLFFVDYLRLAFRHGGFPGYEGIDRGLPPELKALREGLIPF